MRVALIADIHGNLVALEAALAAIADDAVDQIVCLGDVASFGPQPAATLARLRGLGCPVVMGNADAELLDPPPSKRSADDAVRIDDITRWCADQLSAADLTYIRGFAPTVTVPLGDGSVLSCCHGSPRSFDDAITTTTPDDDLAAMLGEVPATVVAAGHTHVPLLRRYRGAILVNPGSVGLPMDPVPPASPVRNPAWTEYGLITTAEDRLAIEFRRVPYDRERLAAATRASAMPHAAWWLADWVTTPRRTA